MIKTRNLVGMRNSRTRDSRRAWAFGLLPLGLGIAAFAPGCGSAEPRVFGGNSSGAGGESSGGTSRGGSTVDGGSTSGDSQSTIGGTPGTGEGGTASGGSESTLGGAADTGEGGTGAQNVGGEPSSAGASAGGETSEGGTGTTEPIDKTPPTVVSVSPTNNAKGVKADATITVTWSEAMDKASAQASFQSAELAGKVTFDWPSDKVMKVTPSEPLVYAKGKHADLATLAAKVYNISLNTSAKDVAGNTLASSAAWKFSTLRQVAWSVTHAFCYQLSNKGSVSQLDSDSGVWVGDYEDDSWYRLAVTFDLSTIPSTAAGVGVATASLPMTPFAPWTGKEMGNPFATLGKVVLNHIQTTTVNSETWALTPLRSLGDVATSKAAGTKTVDVTLAVADDLKNRVVRANRSQFRAEFTKNTDADQVSDAVFFGYDSSLTLSVEYLIP